MSLIQGYEKWNKYSYETFRQIMPKSLRGVKNLEGKEHDHVFKCLDKCLGLLHLKWADQPGIAIFEAMLMGRPVLTMKSFVLASMNPEVLIHNYNAIVADTVEELLDYMNNTSSESFYEMGVNAKNHANMLTSFERQKFQLSNFVYRCLNA